MWSKKSLQQLKKLPFVISKRIISAIDDLIEDPISKEVRKLKGTTYYRLRVGDYRVIFDIDKKHLIILILIVGYRKNIYK